MRYLENAVSLEFDEKLCYGCGMCVAVCPHAVFEMESKRAILVDRGACMECGACALNCATGAIAVKPGVGCAEAIIHSWIYGGEPTCGCSVEGASGDASGGCCASTGPVAPPSEPRELEPAAAGPACCGGATPPPASTAGERPAPS
jgi:NAD-dependent dihydropyrimidine dehydrogenase PreA subunit